MLLPIQLIESAEERFNTNTDSHLEKKNGNLNSEAAVHQQPENIIGAEKNIEKRKEMLSALSVEPLDFAFERAIGKNDSLYSNFIELIADAKRKVGRIVIKSGNKNKGFATGFMVSENLLLTNWHVFNTTDDVEDSIVQFFHELDWQGNPQTAITFKFKPELFFHSNQTLDYCLLALETLDIKGEYPLHNIGYLYLDPTLGKLGNEGEEALNIIHHPNGDYKQLSIRENRFTKILSTSIWYESDTAPGSSGSPVFNDQWQVVALHHMGIAKKNELGEYLDKNNQIIPKVDHKIDSAKVHWIANEGIRISVILKDLFKLFPESSIVHGLKKEYTKPLPSHEHQQKEFINANISAMQISIPNILLENKGQISIHIDNKANTLSKTNYNNGLLNSQVNEALEVSRLELEEAQDFSACKGYQSKFLGISVPLPQPKKTIQKYVAKLNSSNSLELKYYYYSVLFHSIRKMPLLSAINVEGDLDKRLDDSKRGTDVWLRDNRLDYDLQLNDAYYKRSGFDRGHMSRREDANWGNTAEKARTAADLTCMHTNACPQVAALNQSKAKGLWGKLETVILEKGAVKETGKFAKISVFNGPIFKESDPIYKGVQVPLAFFKIILWLDDNSVLKATAFKLSQANLVKEIDFEAIDLDKNSEFKAYQCSIKSLEKETKIDFSGLVKYDTYSKISNIEKHEMHTEADLETVFGMQSSRNETELFISKN